METDLALAAIRRRYETRVQHHAYLVGQNIRPTRADLRDANEDIARLLVHIDATKEAAPDVHLAGRAPADHE
jgi:hypothetical protein